MTAIDDFSDLIADAAQVHLPAPRTPRPFIDLNAPVHVGEITIPDTAAELVEGYSEYGA